MPRSLFPAAAALLLMATAVPAQTVLPGDHSVDGDLCVGGSCTGSEVFDSDLNAQLKVKGSGIGIVFEDTAGTSVNDWALKANAPSEDSFFIEDLTGGTVPFKVLGTAPNNSLYVAANGDVGIGTSIPAGRLHVETTSGTGIRLNRSNTSVGPQAWDSFIDPNGVWGLFDATNGTAPIAVRSGTPSNSLFLAATTAIFNGTFQDYNFDVRAQGSGSLIFADAGTERVGMGTDTPAAPLHVTRDDGSAEVLVENTPLSPSAPRGLFTMRNNGGSFFTMDNTAAGFFTHEQAAPNRFIIADGVTDGPEFSLTAEGDITIPGSFISGATTLNVPDYVFDDGYALRPLSEVASFIDAHSHLPDVPSAAQIADAGLDMTAMQMTLLKKVEELTLYTLEQEAELTRLRGIEARLAQLETLLQATR